MHGFLDHDPADDATFERHPILDIEPEPENEFSRLADMMSSLLVWLSENTRRNVSGLRNQSGTRVYFCAHKVNLRMLAFIYAVRPDLTGPLRELARHCNCSHEAIRKHVDAFRKRFGFHTHLQWEEDARARLSRALSEYYQRKRSQ